MSRDYDAQLLESVAVRRRRLQGAFLWGPMRARRDITDGIGRFAGGCILTAALCAGCVGWSYLHHALAKQATSTNQPSNTVDTTANNSSPLPTSP